jgi:hypothetical protein
VARGRSAKRRLLLAIVEDALRCFQTNLFARERRGQALFHEAEQWFASEDVTSYFSFENICELLGINAQSVRCGLNRWRDEQLQRTWRQMSFRNRIAIQPARPAARAGRSVRR